MEKYIYELKMKVRDYECDLQGIVNNANYQHYLEHTRHEFLTSVGISFADAAEEALARMTRIVETEKHRVAPNCATCTMRCGNTDNYDLARLWTAPENIRALKLRMLRCVFQLAQGRPDAAAQEVIDQDLFVLAEDWDETLLLPVVQRAETLCGR